MNEKYEGDILREAMGISWGQQVLAAGKDPTTGRGIVLESLRQSAERITKTEPSLRADVCLRYIEKCVIAAASDELTDIERNALAFLQSSLISYMLNKESDKGSFVGPEVTAFLATIVHFAFLLGHYGEGER